MSEKVEAAAVEPEEAAGAEETAPEQPEVAAEEPPAEEPSAEEPPAAVADAPAEEAPPAAGAPVVPEPARPPAVGVAAWPFLLYLAAWAALAATTGVALTAPDAAAVPVEDPRYPALLLAGLVLTACGPALVAATWLAAWARAEKGCRGGLFTTALVRGASATLFGVLVWWGALLLVDAVRLGLI